MSLGSKGCSEIVLLHFSLGNRARPCLQKERGKKEGRQAGRKEGKKEGRKEGRKEKVRERSN